MGFKRATWLSSDQFMIECRDTSRIPTANSKPPSPFLLKFIERILSGHLSVGVFFLYLRDICCEFGENREIDIGDIK